MALGTVTEVKSGVFGDLRYAVLDVNVTSGANYTTTGELFSHVNIPGFKVSLLAVSGSPGGSAGFVVVYDAINGKLMAFRQNATTGALNEVPANTDLSSAANRVRLIAFGK